MDAFQKEFPDRFFQIGVAEQNLVTVGAGLAAAGKVAFVSSYAAFMPGRCWEQIRTTICLNEQPVKLIGAHAGISVGPDGATHQMLEDIALMRALPNMVVLAPCDSIEAEKATLAMAKDKRPNYMRMAREATPIITDEKTPFQIGPAYVLEKGADVTLIATGTMTPQAIKAAELLYKDGIEAEVVHVPTIKPLDVKTILQSLKKTGCVVSAEEAQITGGLGSAVAEVIADEGLAVPLIRIGMKDQFGESGDPEQLMHYFGLDAQHIRLAAHAAVERKK
jgi:transketolase